MCDCTYHGVHAGVGGFSPSVFTWALGTNSGLQAWLVAGTFTEPLYLQCLRPVRKPMAEGMPHLVSAVLSVSPCSQGYFKGRASDNESVGPRAQEWNVFSPQLWTIKSEYFLIRLAAFWRSPCITKRAPTRKTGCVGWGSCLIQEVS